MFNQNGNYIMENIFNPFPIFNKAVVKESEAIGIMKNFDNILLGNINGRDAHKCQNYMVYIKDESDLHWLINLFGANRPRKEKLINKFYKDCPQGAILSYLTNAENYNDEDFYVVDFLSGSDSNISVYSNHSVNGNIVPMDNKLVEYTNIELNPDVLDKVYIITNGTPEYSMSGVDTLIYTCSYISKENLEPRTLTMLNPKEKYIV